MKYGDIVWCIKDFYRPFDNPDPILNYPKHAFYKGLGYKIFAINQEKSNHYPKHGAIQWYKMYLIEIDEMYYETFVKHDDYIKENGISIPDKSFFYDFDEYFTSNKQEIRKIKLNILNEHIHNK